MAMAGGDRSFIYLLKREDCKRTKHDSAFFGWKILIGPNDWEYHFLGKEGAERYRTQNLPNCTSCSGVYELGIAVLRRKDGRLDPDYIVPVYVGKSDNVRTRLQRYGREGAHLENENVSGPKRAGLFTEAFSRGLCIVYRWAPMNDNKDAERTEARLLDTFDYAWNKGSNGVRRQNDVFRKVEGITHLPAFIRKLQLSLEKQKGIRIKMCEPLYLENGSDFRDSFISTDFLPQIFKFGRSQPRIVSLSFGVNGDSNTICGVALGHGSVCIRPPIKGNKRCAEHKGMKINSVHESTSNDFQQSHNIICGVHLNDGSLCTRQPASGRKRCEGHKGMRVTEPISIPSVFAGPAAKLSSGENYWNTDLPSVSYSPTCGATLPNGSFCSRKPSEGDKRCWQHAGPAAKLSSGENYWNTDLPLVSYSPTCGATLPNGSFCSRKPSEGDKRCWQHAGPAAKLSSGENYWNTDLPLVSYSPTCGATLPNGSFCSRKPSEGDKRCWQHAGPAAKLSSGENYWNTDLPLVSYSPTCGATLPNGSFCSRKPSEGDKRCWQHAGPAAKLSSGENYWNTDLPSVSYSPTCGATLLNGSFCSRKPSEGNKRCWQHAGPAAKLSSGKNYWNTDLPSVSYSPTCGATLLNGSFCSRKPSEGNKRCWQHAGPAAKLSSGKNYWNTDLPSVSYSPSCGATLRNGSSCSRTPSEGNKRCWQHKGRRI